MNKFKLLRTWLVMLCLLLGVGTSWGETKTIEINTTNSGVTGSYADKTFDVDDVTFGFTQWMKSTNIQAKKSTTNSCYNVDAIPGNIKKITVVQTGTARAITMYGGTSSKPTTQVTSPSTAATMEFDFSGKNYTYFSMTTPGNAVYINTITIEYETSSGGSTPEPTTYNVTIANDITNGTVTASSTSAAEGDEITLTATPADGYEFGSWNVTDASSNTITVTDNKFNMPAADVNVSATFIKEQRPINEIFYESFNTNDGTGGNDDRWSGNIASSTIKYDNEGWDLKNANGANKCAKFGTGSKLGEATTPSLGVACNATLTFNAAAWNISSENTTLKLSVIDGGSISTSTVTLTRGEWTTYEVTLTGLTADSKVKFEGNTASNSRFFLDEISIVKTGDVVTLESITISGSPARTTYEDGENFDPTGLTVTGTFSDSSVETITEGITWSTPDALIEGQTSVDITATVNGITSASYTVTGLTVNAAKTLSSITVSGTPAEFWKGDTFNHDGITVTATYSDESTEDVTNAAIFSGYDMSVAGEQAVTVTYQEKTSTYNINIKTIANTQETAYTVAQAIALIDDGKDLDTEVYVKGIVSEIVTAYSEQYGNISFYISEDGKTTSQQFEFFRNFKGADKKKWASADEAPVVGAEVIGYGTLTKYNSTYEFAEGNYIVSMEKPEVPTPNTYKFSLDKQGEGTVVFKDVNGTVVNEGDEIVDGTKIKGTFTPADGYEFTSWEYWGTSDGVEQWKNLSATTEFTITKDVAFRVTFTKSGSEEPETPTSGNTYDIDLNNEFWGTSYTSSNTSCSKNELSLNGTSNGISVNLTNGESTNMYITDDVTRIYKGYTMTVSVPKDYKITSIVFNEPTSNKKWDGDPNASTGEMSNKIWTGSAQSIAFSFTAQCRVASITVTVSGGTSTPDGDHGTINFVANNNDGYWATFSSTKDVIFPADGDIVPELVGVVDGQILKTDISDESWTMVTDPSINDKEGIYGYYIPAGTGVLLYSTETSGTYYFVKEYEWNQKESINPSDNMLVPCTSTTCPTVEGDNVYYKLAYYNYTNKEGLGFWWGADGGTSNFSVKKGTAILCVPKSEALSKGFAFDMADDTNAIEMVESINSNDVIYNLQGVRLNSLQKGINIVNGRKVIR